jgi:hypothetical protein
MTDDTGGMIFGAYTAAPTKIISAKIVVPDLDSGSLQNTEETRYGLV